MKKKLAVVLCLIFFMAMSPQKLIAMTLEEKIRIEAEYVISCQFFDPNHLAHGAINDVYGLPTWIVPRENGMAILDLKLAWEKLHNDLYLKRANLVADYLVRVQDKKDGAWRNQYSYIEIVDPAKSPTQTAEVMYAFYRLDPNTNEYDEAMENGAHFLLECLKPENKGGLDDGLICGGKDKDGNYFPERWTHDNCYTYWALLAESIRARKRGKESFALECEQGANGILAGIQRYLYNKEHGVWHIAIDQDGIPLKNPHLPCLGSAAQDYPSWIQYSPVMLDLPLPDIDLARVGNWMHEAFQQENGGCAELYCEDGEVRKRIYPGLSFQAAIAWYNISGFEPYANAAITWAEKSGLWIIEQNERLKWVDWQEIYPDGARQAATWLSFIDTSFYYTAALCGGYNFAITPDEQSNKGNKKGDSGHGCFISSVLM